jgi:hypothetical protein
MVRGDEVDLGLWTCIDKAKLIVPMDVHMGRLCRILGLHDDKTISLATALKVTAAFARMNPDDPGKYDFALSRIGILEDCHGQRRAECESCKLNEICLRCEGPQAGHTGSTAARLSKSMTGRCLGAGNDLCSQRPWDAW